MITETGNCLSSSVIPHRPLRSFQSLRWFNGAVHWISAAVLVYAFISNGETNRALIDPVAMRGEVKLGLVVGMIFLLRFIWVHCRRSSGGRWVVPSIRRAHSKIRRITDLGIYFGVAASVMTGILIAILRPGVVLIPEARGFTTSSAALNAAIDAHAFISDGLEWLCGFHAIYSLWYSAIKRTKWSRIPVDWFERVASGVGRAALSHIRREKFRL